MQHLKDDFDAIEQICTYLNENDDVTPPLLLYSLSHLQGCHPELCVKRTSQRVGKEIEQRV